MCEPRRFADDRLWLFRLTLPFHGSVVMNFSPVLDLRGLVGVLFVLVLVEAKLATDSAVGDMGGAVSLLKLRLEATTTFVF